MKHTYDFDDLAEVERRPRTALENRLRMVCRRDYVAFKYFNGANMAACLAERHITGCATKELKTGRFEPEHMRKLAFYLEALDRDRKRPHENPSTGVCRTKDDEVVEYAMNRHLSPALVTQYETQMIPKAMLRQKLHEWNQLLQTSSSLVEEDL